MPLCAVITAILPFLAQDAGPHLRAVPAEVTGFVALNDLPDLLGKGRQNSWYRFLLDPQLAELREWFDLQMEKLEEEAESSGLPSPAEVAADVLAVSAFVAPADETPIGVFGLVVHAREEHEAVARLFEVSYEDMGAESELSLETWRDVELRIFEYAEAGEELDGPGTVACFEREGVFGLVLAEDESSDREHVLAVAHGCLDRLIDDDGGVLANKRYLEARASATGLDHFEGFVDVSSLASFIPRERDNKPIVEALVASISSIPWVYGSARLGAGEEMQGQLGFRCDPNTLIGQLLGLARPVPRDMLALMPDDSVAISVGAFDMKALVDLVLGGAVRYGPEDAEAHIASSRSMVSAQFGVDPIEDFALLFSGEIAFFQRLPEDPDFDLSASPGQVFSMMETMIFGLKDGDTLLDNLDQVLTVTGFENYLEVDDYEDVDIYSVPAEMDVPLSWVITEDFLAISGRREDLEHLIRSRTEPQASILDDKRLSDAFDQASTSTVFSVSDTAAVLKMMGEVFDVIGTTSTLTEETAEFGATMKLFGKNGALSPGLVDKYFSGMMYSSWTIQGGRVQLRTWGR